MRKPEIPTEFDRALLGRNIKTVREMENLARIELARLAKISRETLRQAENGKRMHKRSLLKIAAALGLGFDELSTAKQPSRLKGEDQPFLVHQPEQSIWHEYLDRRQTVPAENQDNIQEPQERSRLGRLGFVPLFATSPSFMMPAGPGSAFLELYGIFEENYNSHYRDCLLHCLRGEALLTLNGETIPMKEGTVVGFQTDQVMRLEPAKPVGPNELPPLLLWVGANRVGSVLSR